LTVTQAASVGSTLDVTGVSTLRNNTTVSSNLTVTQALDVTGVSTLRNNLNVTSGSIQLNNVTTQQAITATTTNANAEFKIINNANKNAAFGLDTEGTYIVAAGQRVLTISETTANLGIGSGLTPQTPLHVKGATTLEGATTVTSGDFKVSSGMIGIGTSPTSKLHVDGGSIKLTNIASDQTIDATTSTGKAEYKLTNNNSKVAALGVDDTNGYIWVAGRKAITINHANSNVGIGSGVTPANTLSVAGGTSVGYDYTNQITPINGMLVQGVVGIGTTDPSRKLHVHGDSIYMTSTRAQAIEATTSSDQAEYKLTNSAGKTAAFGITGTTAYLVADGGSGQYKLFLDSISGNVGIGESSPASKLVVAGTITATGLTIPSGGTVSFPNASIPVSAINGSVGGSATPSGWTVSGNNISTSSNTTVYGSFAASNGFTSCNGMTACNGLTVASGLLTTNSSILIAKSNSFIGVGTTDLQYAVHASSTFNGSLNGDCVIAVNHPNFRYDQAVLFQQDQNGLATIWNKNPNAALQYTISGGYHQFMYGQTTELMRIKNDGSVGIGKTDPSGKLHVHAGSIFVTGAGEQVINATSSGTKAEYKLTNSTGKLTALGVDDANSYLYANNNTRALTIAHSTGYIGIGSSIAAANTLSVGGAASVGSTYANAAAPTNGMLIEGTLGLGTTTPSNQIKLHVNGGAIRIDGASLEQVISATSTGTKAEYKLTNSSACNTAFGVDNSNAYIYAAGRKSIYIDHVSSNVVIDGGAAQQPLTIISSASKTEYKLVKYSTNQVGALGIDANCVYIYTSAPSGYTFNINHSTGNVGIGLTNPSTILQVNGTITTTSLVSTGLASFSNGLTVSSGTTSLQAATVASGLTVSSGTTSLQAATVASGLTVSSGTTSLQTTTVASGLTVTSGTTTLSTGDLTVSSGQTNVKTLNISGDNNIVNITSADKGEIKYIRTNNNTDAALGYDGGGFYIWSGSKRLQIDSSSGLTTVNSGLKVLGNDAESGTGAISYWSGGGTGFSTGTNWGGNISIAAANHVKAIGFISVSDRRVKKDIETLTSDFETFNAIQPVSYKYKDYLKGTTIQHGFIAQDLQKVLPNSVNTTNDFIPDIFVLSHLNSKQFQLSADVAINVDDKVRLIIKDVGQKDVLITSVDNGLITCDIEDGIDDVDVFVYGRYVTDFLSINHNHLISYTIAHTQELYKMIKSLQQEVADLKAASN
jgi:hypothetical protein